MFELGRMPQIKAEVDILTRIIVAIISVRVKTFFNCLAGTFVYCFQCFSQELSVVIIVPFRKRMVFINNVRTDTDDGSEAGLYRKMHIHDPHFL
jgi:predicted amidohydrolase